MFFTVRSLTDHSQNQYVMKEEMHCSLTSILSKWEGNSMAWSQTDPL